MKFTYKVEKGVALPKNGRDRGPCPFPFAEMAIGDSFRMPLDVCESTTFSNLRRHARYYTETHPDFAITTRLEDGGKAVRVWRIKPDELRPRSKRKLEHDRAAAAANAPAPAAASPIATSAARAKFPPRGGGDSYMMVDGKRVPR